MKHTLLTSIALVSALTASAFAQTITPTRVGPVSQYGQLITGKTSQGKGQIYGSCEGVKDGAEVQVRGMSLYWSLMPQAMEFWSGGMCLVTVRLKSGLQLRDAVYAPVPGVFSLYGDYEITVPFFS